jgi:SAM-dependent methyltransferase
MIMGFKSALENLKVDLKLVFVGDYPPFILEKINFIAQKVNLPRDRIITTGYLSDEELSILYHSGLALLFPSLYEGFGLPIVEAQSAGMPVITCRNSAITETAGDSALYVDEHDPNSIAQGIIEIYHNTGLRAELIRKGLENHRKFSWRKVALDTVAHLEEFCFADNGKAKLSSSGGHRPVIQDYLYNIDNHTIRPGTLLRANVLLPLLISLAEMKADLLDIGGFDGFISKTMHNLTGKRPLLLDLDFKGLQKAKLQGIPAIKGSAGKLPFDDNSFGLIWALDLLEHMEHPKQALSEIARVLKPEGVFLITTPIKGRNWGLPELEMLTLHKKWGHIYPGFSETEISAMFNEARLYIEDVSGYFCELTGTIYHHLYVSGAFPLDENSASRIWHSTVKNLEYALPSKPLEYILIGSKTSKISPAISNLIATPDFGLAQKLSTADKATDIALSDWIDDYNREFNYKRIKIPLKSQELIDKVCSCLKSKLKRA